VKVALPERDYWKDAEFERLRGGEDLQRYVEANFEKHSDTFRRLAESDAGDPSRYPGFDELYAALDTKASKDDVRELLREFVRKRVQDDLGKPLYLDFQTDVVLQTGILESCRMAGIDAKEIREYDTFAKAPRPVGDDPK
jgi:hypothetical protein